MGELEKKIKDNIRATKIQTAILKTISIAGVLSVATLAPNALKLLKYFDLDKKIKRNKEYAIQKSRKRLIEKGLVHYNLQGLLALTPSGQKTLEWIERKNFQIKKPKKWDGKWRVLIFDIPETKKIARNNIRIKLQNIGFIKLQNSVWVYPYDCEDIVVLLKADFGIGKEVLYMIVDQIENDKKLKQFFGV